MKDSIIILSLILLISCSETDKMDEQYFNLYAGLEFSIFNSEDEDLLNPDNPNHLNTDNIKIFYVINGESQEYYEENLDYPRGFKIYEYEGVYRIGIFLNYTETEDRPVTYVQWGNNIETDTIKVLYQRTKNSIIQDAIWLNSVQIWELGDNTVEPYFTLQK